MSDEEMIAEAIKLHPDCSFGTITNGMDATFCFTKVVLLWPDKRSWEVGNRPKYEVGGFNRRPSPLTRAVLGFER